MRELGNLTIIIPVGPNDDAWVNLLADLTMIDCEAEIILSACQVQPSGLTLPKHVYWIHAKQGRAQQLNAGAISSARDFIWFLHADTLLTPDVIKTIQHFLNKQQRVLSYFSLSFASDGPFQTRMNAWAANLRSSVFGLPFGDQGLIMHRDIFEQVNGFDESLVIGEDLDFVVRVKAAGFILRQLPAELVTSARRYRQYGWFSTTLKHLWLTALLTYQARQRLRQVV